MSKKYGTLFSFGVILIFLITSCRLPYKIVPNLPTTPLPSFSKTPLPSMIIPSPTVSVQQTPTPENTPVLVSIEPEKGSVLTWIDYSNFVYIPGGKYGMGKESYDQADFAPFHEVTLTAFWIQQAEVTNQQYAQCVSDGKCSPPMQELEIPYWYENEYDGNHPVVGVTWFQAREYCTYIRSRLPSEAEWEAAARGSERKTFPWGGDKPDCNYANFKGCLVPAEPLDIRSYDFGASDFFVLDMAGNVREWVADWYGKDYYQSSPELDPLGPLDGRKRVYRGGSYRSSAEEMATYLRNALEPEKQASDLGFRCVLDGDPLKVTALQPAQPCTLLSGNDPAQIQPTSTPFPCSAASVSGFCQLLSGKPSYGIEIFQSGCRDNNLYSMTGNSQPLSCSISQLSDGGNKFHCTFPGMGQGIKVNINYCNVLEVPQVDITCPLGYQLDQHSRQCELINAKLPTPPCPKGYQEVTSIGCLPVYDPADSGCPIGYYSIETPSGYVCMPLNKCQFPSGSDSCANTACEVGQKYDPFDNCCASADSPKRTCASYLIYNPDQNSCLSPDLFSKKCNSTLAKIPYCPTLTPSPMPTREAPPDCSVYHDPDVCIANGCQWKVGFFSCY